MKEWTKFSDEVAKCLIKSAKEELGIKIGDEIDKKQNIELTRLRFRCYYQKLRNVGVERFDKLIEELMTSIAKPSEVLEERQYQYQIKFQDPREVTKQKEFLVDFSRAVLSEVDDAVDIGDTRLITRMFHLSFVGNIINQVYIGFLEPLLDMLTLANLAVGLNADWAAALIAVALDEALVKKKLRELKYEPKKKDNYHKLVEKLVELLKNEDIRPAMDVFLTDGFRNIRHEIIHDPVKWKPKENEVNEIVRHTIDLTKALWPNLFESKEDNVE